MNIQIMSDLHLEFEPFSWENVGADVVVLAGDIHVGQKGVEWVLENIADVPVVYVLGNHEYYRYAVPKLRNDIQQRVEGTNVYVLENDRCAIGDTLFLGCTLWTDFSLQGNPRIAAFEARQVLNDFAKIRVSPSFRRFRPFDSVGLFRGSLRWLKAELTMANGADVVVVTHHAPSKLSVPQCFHDDLLSAAFASHLDEFIESSAIDLWIHGHIHESRDYEIGDTRIVCNPRGYPDAINADFDPGMVVST